MSTYKNTRGPRNRASCISYMSTYKIFLNYTDAHDVDEDLRTITHHGGDWTHICRAGVTERFISTDTSFVNEYVASYV